MIPEQTRTIATPEVFLMDPLFDLAGRTALITGGGQNLGAGIASTLGRLGAHVVVNDLVAARAQTVADDITAGGGSASIPVFDVTDFDAVMTGVESVRPV